MTTEEEHLAGGLLAKEPPDPRPGAGVQSIGRAFTILETMADAGGIISLSQLATDAGLPPTTIHRLLRTLVALGYVRQEPSRQYSLGPRLMRLVDASTRRLDALAHPHLAAVVNAMGESANLAVLDGDEIVYVAEVQPTKNSMHMSIEIGRRVHPHATAVGKAVLATESDQQVGELLRRAGMARYTEHTLVTEAEFIHALTAVRECGYAIDDQEQELGVLSIAVAVPDAPRPLAMSVSGPTGRMTEVVITRTVPILVSAAADLGRELATSLKASDHAAIQQVSQKSE